MPGCYSPRRIFSASDAAIGFPPATSAKCCHAAALAVAGAPLSAAGAGAAGVGAAGGAAGADSATAAGAGGGASAVGVTGCAGLDAGRITLDGIDITNLSRRELRDEIGMVLQDAWLFKGTIRENIAYGRPGASEEEIRAAAEATYVDRFVQHLPDGYDTVLDDEGGNVSAGEKQLITIARAFLSAPSLLILDEATSSVDTRTELLLQQAMAALRTDRTSFVIAHRLSTIRDADLILVMEDGRIVEQGTHDGLLAADGAYARLYNAQFRAAIEPEAPDGAELREEADAR